MMNFTRKQQHFVHHQQNFAVKRLEQMHQSTTISVSLYASYPPDDSLDLNNNMIAISSLFLLINIALQQVDHTAIQPQVVKVNIKPEIKTVPSKHSFSAPFKGIGYEISGRVFETNQGLLDSQIHNSTFYRPSQSCFFYSSQLQLQVINDKRFSDNLNIQNSVVSKKLHRGFLLVSNNDYLLEQNTTSRVLVGYSFSQDGYADDGKNRSIRSLGLNDSSDNDIGMVVIEDVLVVTDGVVFVGIDTKDMSNSWIISVETAGNSKTSYQFTSANNMLNFELCHVDTSKNWMKVVLVWDSQIQIYHFSLDLQSATLTQALVPPTSKLYTSVVIDHNIYALIEGQLIAYRTTANLSIIADYVDLQSKQCFGLNKYESTLHMICKEGGVNYVAEMFFNESFVKASEALKLNRYYTQIDDARLLFRFGSWDNPKLLISGDEEFILTAYGINREVLLQSQVMQNIDRYKSLGVEDITTIASFSNISTSYAIGVGTGFLIFFRINEIPAEIECNLQRKANTVRWNILAEINTTSCFANGHIEQLESICQISVPFTYYVSLFEVDSSKELTVNIFVYVVLAACMLLLFGCAFHCKSMRARATAEIRKKIEAMKKKKGMKPI